MDRSKRDHLGTVQVKVKGLKELWNLWKNKISAAVEKCP